MKFATHIFTSSMISFALTLIAVSSPTYGQGPGIFDGGGVFDGGGIFDRHPNSGIIDGGGVFDGGGVIDRFDQGVTAGYVDTGSVPGTSGIYPVAQTSFQRPVPANSTFVNEVVYSNATGSAVTNASACCCEETAPRRRFFGRLGLFR